MDLSPSTVSIQHRVRIAEFSRNGAHKGHIRDDAVFLNGAAGFSKHVILWGPIGNPVRSVLGIGGAMCGEAGEAMVVYVGGGMMGRIRRSLCAIGVGFGCAPVVYSVSRPVCQSRTGG